MADAVTSQTIQDGQRKAVLKFTNISDGTGESAVTKGYHDYSDFSGIPNDAGSGKTGDMKFTTIGAGSGDTYTVILEVLKTY